MLTALAQVDDIVEGLDCGVNDYLTKPFRFIELQARLCALLRGFNAQTASVMVGDWLLKPHSGIIEDPDGRAVSLTDAETRLLSVLAAAPDHVFSREELLSPVFSDGSDMGTVDVYVSYLRGKTTRTIIETVRGRGYRIGSPEGATVAVSLGCARHRQWAQIRVSDHGPVIGGDPERLFRRFARDGDGTAHQGYELGLALARDVANRYGGLGRGGVLVPVRHYDAALFPAGLTVRPRSAIACNVP